MITRFMHIALICVVGLLVTTGDAMAQDTKSGTSGKKKGAAKKKTTGVELNSQEGRFSVEFPAGFTDPAENVVEVEIPGGTLPMTMYTASKGATSAYLVAFLDYPEESFEQGIESMLDGAREGALKNMNATLESQKSITLNGHPGRSITFAGFSGEQRVYGRIDYFIAKPRLYQVLYLTSSKTKVNAPEITACFESFTIITDTTEQ